MAKDIKSIIELFKEKYKLNVIFKPVSTYNDDVSIMADTLYNKVQVGKKIDYLVINQLKDLILRYPDLPVFYNYLYSAYYNKGKKEFATGILDIINSRFPDYIFGVTQRSLILISQGLVSEAKQWIGEKMDIKNRFPKEFYHYTEVKSY